ncbi:hypothetical protein JCM3775_007061 [Rhodotorula graminis]
MGQVLSIDQADYPVPAGAALQENANWTLTPLFVGWAGNVFLCGIVVSWAASYWPRAKGDKPLVKLAVVVAVLFECLTAIANFWSLVDHGKDQDRTNSAISLLRGPDALSVTLGTVVAVAVQSFFATRCVRILPLKWRLPFIVWTWGLIIASFGGAVGITAIEFINKGATDVTRGASPDAYSNLFDLALAWLFCGMAADVSISTVLVARLWTKARAARTEHGDPDLVPPLEASIWGFMRLALEAALATSITSLAAGVTYVTLTATTNVSYAPSNLLPGLYACSLLWVLNSAHRLADEINLAQLNSIQLVWQLGPASSHLPPSSSPATAAAAAAGGASPLPSSAEGALGPSNEQRRAVPHAVAQVVHGVGPGTWELKRGLASAKARQRLGEDEIHVMSIRRRMSGAVVEPQLAGPVTPPPPFRWGRGSIVSLFGGSAGSGSGNGCGAGRGGGGAGASGSGLEPPLQGRESIGSMWTTGTSASTAKTGFGTDEAV